MSFKTSPFLDLPDTCKRLVYAFATPRTHQQLQQVHPRWREAHSERLVRDNLAHTLQSDFVYTLEDPESIQRAFRRAVCFERQETERLRKYDFPARGVQKINFALEPSCLIGVRNGGDLVRFHLTNQIKEDIADFVSRYIWGANRSDLFVAAEWGGSFLIQNIESDQTQHHFPSGFADISLDFDVDPLGEIFAEGGWEGVGQVVSIPDSRVLFSLPQADGCLASYSIAVVSFGAHVVHSSASSSLSLTEVQSPHATSILPDWFDLDKLRRNSSAYHPDIYLKDETVFELDFFQTPFEMMALFEGHHDILDVRTCSDSDLWVTLHANKYFRIWKEDKSTFHLLCKKKIKTHGLRIWTGASGHTFAVQETPHRASIWSWRLNSCWFHGHMAVSGPSAITMIDISSEGDFCLMHDEDKELVIKRIAKKKSFNFWKSEPFPYHFGWGISSDDLQELSMI